MAEKIVFPDVPPPHVVFERPCVEFPAVRGARRFRCLATVELLRERFEAGDFSEKELLRAYEMHRPQIQAIARSQILAGKVSPANEVLLTTETFAFKDVTFSDGVRESPYYFRLARQVTAELEEVLGPSAGLATVKWERAEDAEDRVLFVLAVQDFVAQVSLAFTPEQLEHSRDIRNRLYRLWGDLLQDRNHKQLQDLLGAGQPED